MDDSSKKPLLGLEHVERALDGTFRASARTGPPGEVPRASGWDDRNLPPGPPPLLEERTIARIRRFGPPELFSEAVRLYLEDAPVAIRELKRSVEVGDLTATRRIAHKTKGSSGSIGAARLADLFGQCELAAVHGHLPDGRWFRRISEVFEATRQALLKSCGRTALRGSAL